MSFMDDEDESMCDTCVKLCKSKHFTILACENYEAMEEGTEK